MTINDAVATRVLKLMKEKGITQYRLEKQSYIAHGAMDKILNKKNRSVSFTTVYRLAHGFGMSLNEFLDDEIFSSEEIEIE